MKHKKISDELIVKKKKPWGREELLEVNDSYVIKFLIVKRGCRLSKQYHNKKLETMILIHGDAILELGNGWQTMKPLNPYTIRPKMVHRVTALLDSTILEVSTSFLDDTHRMEDDYARK